MGGAAQLRVMDGSRVTGPEHWKRDPQDIENKKQWLNEKAKRKKGKRKRMGKDRD